MKFSLCTLTIGLLLVTAAHGAGLRLRKPGKIPTRKTEAVEDSLFDDALANAGNSFDQLVDSLLHMIDGDYSDYEYDPLLAGDDVTQDDNSNEDDSDPEAPTFTKDETDQDPFTANFMPQKTYPVAEDMDDFLPSERNDQAAETVSAPTGKITAEDYLKGMQKDASGAEEDSAVDQESFAAEYATPDSDAQDDQKLKDLQEQMEAKFSAMQNTMFGDKRKSPKISIVYDSLLNHTRQMAEAAAEGCMKIAEFGDVHIVEVKDANFKRDVLQSDAIILGSPVILGNPSVGMLSWMRDWKFEDLGYRVGAAFCTGAGYVTGSEHTLDSLHKAMMTMRMVVVGGSDWHDAIGACAITEGGGPIKDEYLQYARDLGKRVATVASLLAGERTQPTLHYGNSRWY